MCLTVKEVKEILDGMRDDALVMTDKELDGGNAMHINSLLMNIHLAIKRIGIL